MSWTLNRKREMAEDYLFKYDDATDKSNYRHPYLKRWMLKEYQCATMRELRSWIAHG